MRRGFVSGRLATLEDLDDEHFAAAARTGLCERLGLGCRRLCVERFLLVHRFRRNVGDLCCGDAEQLACERDVVDACAVGEQP
jgi:hypothetical protein